MDEENLPIDIQCRKLLDWLHSRRICNKEWHHNVLQIREKIGAALQDMPEHPEIRDLLSGANINYFHCLKIVEILKETEASTKNFFGGYGSQRMTDWKQVVASYQRDQIYLAEAAQLLIQAVAYELPAAKRQIQKCGQTQADCDKKIKNYEKKVEEFQAEYNKGCQALGIPGKSLRREIVSLLQDLPEIYAALAEETRKLEPYREIYQSFTAGVHGLEAQATDEKVLPNLKFLMERGNVTTYEWVHGEPPLEIVTDGNTIDFGDAENDEDEEEGGATKAEIDFDIQNLDGVDLEVAGDEINWDDLDVAADDAAAAGTDADAGIEIDWDAVDTDISAIEGLTVEESGVEGGVARDGDALSMLDNRRTRNLILDELHELQAFYMQRQCEIANLESGGSANLSLTSDHSEMTAGQVTEALSHTKHIIGQLSTGKLHHLQLVRGSPKYVDRLVGDLKQKLRLVERTKSGISELASKRESAVAEESQMQSEIKKMAEKTKVLQKEIEADLSKRYKGRKVNIMGGVQSLTL